MVSPCGIVTITTDFGTRDPYVAAMKGVILSRAPDLTLVDLCHDTEKFGIAQAAFVLSSACPTFPAGTVHLVVVDPGVGSDRRALVVRGGGQFYVAPDNGVLTPLLLASPAFEAFAVPIPAGLSTTFHGRDLFAPAAAEIASGGDLLARCEAVDEVVTLDWPAPSTMPGGVRGAVLFVDSFGNIVTNLDRHRFGGRVCPGGFTVEVGGHRVSALYDHYRVAPAGEVFAIWGSAGFLEISMREASAAERLEVQQGCPVDLLFPAA